MNNYQYLAEYYDTLTGNVDYYRRADFVVSIIGASLGLTILDAGCGTGMISSLLLDKGIDVIGVDNSAEMLSIARNRNPNQLLLQQNIVELDLYGTVEGVICFQDTLNHLSNLKDVEKCFSKFSLFSEKGSILMFDTNTLFKHSHVLSNNSFVYETDNVFCVWQNNYNLVDNSVNMQLDFFVSSSDNTYHRESERIREIYIPDDWIKEVLPKYGYSLIKTIDGDSYDNIRCDTERIMYIARKENE